MLKTSTNIDETIQYEFTFSLKICYSSWTWEAEFTTRLTLQLPLEDAEKVFPSRGRFWFKAVMYSQKSSCYLTSLEVCTVNLGGSVWVYQNTSRQTVVAWVCSGQMCCDIWVLCQKCCDISVYWLLIDPSCQRSRKHGHHGNRATHQP